MPAKFEYIEIDCGYIKYLIIKGRLKYYIVYAPPFTKMIHFASVPNLKQAYIMVRSHLRGRHQTAFLFSELRAMTSGIKIRDFETGFLHVKNQQEEA